MSFGTFSGAAFTIGMLALAAALFALSRLRVRHRALIVPTTLFWREAIEETRARVFVQRFRHPLAYALVLGIAAAIWLACADPRTSSANATRHVLVVDASAAMAGDRFAAALAAVRERASRLPRDTTSIVLAGARPELALAADEPLATFDRRMESRRVDAHPPSVERAVLELFATANGPTSIEVCGVTPIGADLVALAPAATSIARIPCADLEPSAARGVSTLGISEAESGTWDRVDLAVVVHGAAASDVRVTLGDAELTAAAIDASERGTRFTFRDLPARGGRVDVAFATAAAADAKVTAILPLRTPLRVAVSSTVPSTLVTALKADRGVEWVEADPTLVVRTAGEDFFPAVPALEVSSDPNAGAFVVRRSADGSPDAAVRAAFLDLGLADIDAMELARQTARPIDLVLESAPTRGVAVQAELLDERFDFVQSRAFPLFVARTLRWLAQATPLQPAWAAGAWLEDGSDHFAAEDGRTIDGAGFALRLPRAQTITTATGRAARVSMLDASLQRRARSDALAPVADASSGGLRGTTIAALLALALLAVEWWLVRSERMP
jgi:hypothetical protein